MNTNCEQKFIIVNFKSLNYTFYSYFAMQQNFMYNVEKKGYGYFHLYLKKNKKRDNLWKNHVNAFFIKMHRL